MNELDTHTFRLAVAQFDEAAEAMRLDANLRERLKLPQRSLIVSVPSGWMTVASRSLPDIASSMTPHAVLRREVSGIIPK